MNRKGNLEHGQPTLTPGVSTSQLPPFHDLGEYTFQDLCRDLFEFEPDIVSAEIYGTRGQSQHGIDVIAYTASHPIEVAQCKCQQSITPAEIEAITDKFFESWDVWSDREVRRFILAVACSLSDKHCQDQIIKERKRFLAKGIRYDCWGPPQLTRLLRPQASIVRQHFDNAEFWVNKICGVHLALTAQSSTIGAGAQFLHAQLDLLSQGLGEELGHRIDQLKADWHRGHRIAVDVELRAIREDTTKWVSLSPELRARILRFQACVILEFDSDVQKARKLHTESASVFPEQDDTALRALLVLHESGFDAALAELEGEDTRIANNFRRGLLLDAGRASEAIATAADDDPDALRTQALALAVTGNIDEATRTIESALAVEPEWESLRFGAAAIHYLAAIAPGARPDRIPFAPEPQEWALVRKDGASQHRLGEAMAILARLISECEGERHRRRYQGWLVACSSNRVGGQEVAQETISEILKDDPSFWPATIWGLARGYEFDTDRVIAAFDEALGKLFDPAIAMTRAACLVTSGRPSEAVKSLEADQEDFASADALPAWLYWMVQALLACGDEGPAEEILLGRDPERIVSPHAWSLLLRRNSQNHASSSKDELLRLFEATADAIFLLDACEIAASEKDWDWIASHAELVHEKLGTDDAQYLLAIAFYNTGDFEQALSVVDAHAERLGAMGITPQLRRVRLAAGNQLGLLTDAVADAEKLVAETGTPESLLELARLQIQTGDTPAASRVSQQLLRDDGLDAGDAIRLAFALKNESRQLAQELIEFALNSELPDELVGPAFALGSEFGLGAILKPIAKRFAELGHAGRAGVKAMSFDEVLAMATEWRKQSEHITGLYEEGRMPVHLVASNTRTPLARIYGRQFSYHEGSTPDPSAGWVLSFFGGRPPLSTVALPESRLPRLNFDITSLLLARRLGVLGAIIKEFGTIRLPKATIPALLEMRERLAHAQPKRLSAARTILAAVECDALKVVETPEGRAADVEHLRQVLASVADESSQVVAFRSLCTDLASLSDEPAAPRAFTCGSIVRALQKEGPLTSSEADRYLEQLGTEEVIVGEQVPSQGSSLLFYANTIGVVVEAGLLPLVLERFPTMVEADEVARLRAEVDAADKTEPDVVFVDDLVAGLNRRLADGTVEFIDERGAARHGDFESDGPLEEVLSTLLSFKEEEGDLLVADDRFLNSYKTRGSVPIATIPELLAGLRRAGRMGGEEFHRCILGLRAGHARYIPLELEELNHHLCAASTADGGLIETTGLSVIRRYIAGVVLSLKSLKEPEDASVSYGETVVIINMRRAILESVSKVWEVESAPEAAKAKSAWVMVSLYYPFHALCRDSRGETLDDPRLFYGLDLAALIMDGLRLKGGSDGPRQRYLNWLDGVVDEAMELDPRLIHPVCRVVKESFRSALLTAERAGSKATGVRLLQDFFDDLPQAVRLELGNDPALLNEIGIELRKVVTVGDLTFRRTDYFGGAEAAVNGLPELVVVDGYDVLAEFCPASCLDRSPAFTIVHHKACELQSDDRLQLLLSDEQRVRDAVRQNRNWFDGAMQRRTELENQILALPPQERPARVDELCETSPAVFYERLEEDLHRRQAFEFSHLLSLSPKNILSHFGLSGAEEGGPKFESAGALLAEVYGPVEAFTRLAALPVPIPSSVSETLLRKDNVAFRSALRELLKECRLPIARLHLLRLLTIRAGSDSTCRRLARWMVRSLLTDASVNDLEALLPAVRWFWDSYSRRGGQQLADWQRLAVAWGHAGQTVKTLLRAGAPPGWVKQTFERRSNRVDVETFSGRAAHQDVSHPWRQRPAQILLAGLACALDSCTELLSDCAGSINKYFVREIAGAKAPRSEVFTGGPDGSNELGAFLARSYLDCFQQLVSGDGQPVLGAEELDALLADAIRRVAENPNDDAAWTAIGSWAGRLGPVDPEARQVVLAAFDDVDLIALWDKSPHAALYAIDVIGRTLAGDRDENRDKLFRAALVELVRHHEMRSGADADHDERLISVIVNTVAGIADSPDEPTSVREYGEFLEQVEAAGPWTGKAIRFVVESLVTQLSPRGSLALWPTVARLRGSK